MNIKERAYQIASVNMKNKCSPAELEDFAEALVAELAKEIEALSSSTSTDELDAYVAWKVKSARVIDEKQIAYLFEERSALIKQRDLAVEFIANVSTSPKLSGSGWQEQANMTLAAIKESGATK